MKFTVFKPLTDQRRRNWIRLRTLVVLRWTAIAGQLGAVLVAYQLFRLDINLGLCFMVIGASVIANLIAIFVFPESKRLTEREILMMLLFDIGQLSALLYLTGGLNNPFAMLILVPVTISATALRTRHAVLMGLVAIILVSFIVRFYVPLRNMEGAIVGLPEIFTFGFWVAIVIGVIFLGAYTHRVTGEVSSMSEALLAVQMVLAREQKITDLAGVVAAMAHELGTPLATIKLASSELMSDLKDRPELCDDAALIHDQADRCRDILHSMGRAGKDDLHMRQAPLCAVLQEAAEPHSDRGINLRFSPDPETCGLNPKPIIFRRPEIIHGLRSLIQNAVDFAESTVWIDSTNSRKKVTIRIIDDGPGYPPHLIGRIGEPFLNSPAQHAQRNGRREYEGMGLGLFIAKTLLERTGAELFFANAGDSHPLQSAPGERCGAIVEVVWPSSAVCVPAWKTSAGLGLNQPVEI